MVGGEGGKESEKKERREGLKMVRKRHGARAWVTFEPRPLVETKTLLVGLSFCNFSFLYTFLVLYSSLRSHPSPP